MKYKRLALLCLHLASSLVLSSGAMASSYFIHPGALDSEEEFKVRSEGVRDEVHPWLDGFSKLRSNSHDVVSYEPHPVSNLVRGTAPGHAKENYSRIFNDAAAAYALALDWRVSGDESRAEAAKKILDAWAVTLKSINGTSDKYLASGIYGYQMAVAGETLRGYSGWSQDEIVAFQDMLVNVFAPMNQDFLENHNGARIDHYWANWDLANTASLMAIGVFAGRKDFYDQARDYYLNGSGNGSIKNAAWKVYSGGFAQWQESGRDQGHTMLGLGLAGIICEIAEHQGDDLFSAYNNRLLAAARYVASYNLGATVPYTEYKNSDVVQPVISSVGRGQVRPIWALLWGEYVQKRKLSGDELKSILDRDGVEGGGGDYGPNSGGFDQLGFGTLTFLDKNS